MSRIVYDMDRDWSFHRGDVELGAGNSHSDDYSASKSGAAQGPAGKLWSVGGWREVDLPHDYYAESDFAPENKHTHGYRSSDNAWYRKTFLIDSSLADKEFMLVFEGTAVNAEFYLNGSLMARSYSAYTETAFDVTDRLYFGVKPNVLAVHINGKAFEGWWYEGAGIYRHVKLYVKDKLHIAHNGVFGKPTLKKGTKNSWNVSVETVVENSNYFDTTASVRATLLDGDRIIASSQTKAQRIEYASKAEIKQALSVSRPTRWDVDAPKLYTLKVEVMDEKGEVVDEQTERIGFRTFLIDADKGFFLNGRPLKIKGTCNHQDHAGVGVAVPDSVQYYRIKRLKEMGSNAYRCSHNLPNKAVLDACDELGMIVMDENRRFESSDEVLRNVEIMIRRDRNHPSVIFWSLFNEEPLQNTEEGAKIYRRMKNLVLHLDDSRLITGAINGNMDGAGLEMDVTGINYTVDKYNRLDEFHGQYPSQPIIGSENNSAITTRGCYKSDRENAHVLSNYDEEAVMWGATVRDNWKFTMERDWYAGIFIWTGFDYRGEPTPFKWPSVSSQFGIMDTCGFAKDSFYYNKACFDAKPMIHLLPHWNWKSGELVRVAAPSNCDEAELFLNGKSLGRKKCDCINTAEWQVEFIAGRLLVKGFKNGKCVAKAEQRTAGKPYAVKLIPQMSSIKNDGADTAIVNVAVVDKNGIVVPYASNLVNFKVNGDGYVRGVGNGDPNSHESDTEPKRCAYCGLCQVLVTSRLGAESIELVAESDGLEGATLKLEVERVEPPMLPKSVSIVVLDNFTMSQTFEDKPNALAEISDDDMNSFIPVTFVHGALQTDFTDGWRMYRARVESPSDAAYTLMFEWACFNAMTVYINDECIFDRAPGTIHRGKLVTEKFKVKKSEKLDIRILVYARESDVGPQSKFPNIGAGFADFISLEPTT